MTAQPAVFTLTDANFDTQIAEHDVLVIDAWAPWCEPCKPFREIFHRVAAQYPHISFAELNVETEKELAIDLAIRSVPVVLIFRQQVLVFSQAGVIPEATLADLIDQALKLDVKALIKS